MYGFQCKGSHGILQIDGKYKNLNLYKKATMSLLGGSIKTGSYSEVGKWSQFPITASSGVNLIAFIPNEYCIVNYSLTEIQQPFRSNAGACELFCFSDDNTKYFNSNYGMQIRNTDSLIEVYNSNWAVLRIVDIITLPGGTTNYRYTMPQGKKCAVCIGGGKEQYDRSQQNMYSTASCFKVLNNVLYVDFIRTSWYYPDDDEISYVSSDFNLYILIIDVTGY